MSDILRLDAGDADTAAERFQLYLLFLYRTSINCISLISFDILLQYVVSALFLSNIFHSKVQTLFRCSEKLVDLVMMITNKLDTQVAALRTEQNRQNEENAKR